MKRIVLSLVWLSIVFAGCSSTRQTKKEEPSNTHLAKKMRLPAVSVRIASIDLGHYAKRISLEDVRRFGLLFEQDSVDILTIQGITRYPDLHERVDVVDELTRIASVHRAFGETMTLSGRQSGNAVFSTYPIKSSENTHYDNLHSTGMEAALQAIIDCGVRDIVVISTRLPQRASTADQTSAVMRLGSFSNFYINHPIVVTGNLPKSNELRALAAFNDVHSLPSGKALRVWYSKNGTLEFQQTKVEDTVLGSLVIVQFGIYQQSHL
jgi:endonuclease/exonuclease/phosphatase family metal-dependent hydrolase